jgi:hypothetical protein
MEKSSLIKLLVAVGLLALAGFLVVRQFQQNQGISDRTFFYDLSEKKLFVGPRTAIPPIRGLNDAALDAVRAVVIATNGNPRDPRARTIAYLEMYSPELKQQMEQAQATGTSPPMGRGLAQGHRFVRRQSETNWHSLASAEGEKIVSEWLTAGPGGGPAAVCTP